MKEKIEIDGIVVVIGSTKLEYHIPTRWNGQELSSWILKNDDTLQELKEKHYNRRGIKMSKENKMLSPTGANTFNDKDTYNTKNKFK